MSKRVRSNTGYDDVEQLLMQVGILGAFLLSISVAWEPTVLPGAMDQADFYGLLGQSGKFREYVVDTLEAQARAKTPPEAYDFIVPVGGGQVLDMKYELLTGISARLGTDKTPYGIPYRTQYHDMKLNAVAQAIKDDFPMSRMWVWFLASPDDRDGLEIISLKASGYAAGSTLCFLIDVALFGTLYMSLAYSSAREDVSWPASDRFDICAALNRLLLPHLAACLLSHLA